MSFKVYSDTVDLGGGNTFVRRFLFTEGEAEDFVSAGLACEDFGRLIGLEDVAALRQADFELQSHRSSGGRLH